MQSTTDSFPKFVSESRSMDPSAGISSSGSSSSGNVGSSSGAKGPLPPPPPPPLNLCMVINICHYLTPLSKLIILSQPLESSSGEAEREAFLALQSILSVLDTGKNEPINIFPFLDKFCRYIGTGFNDFEEMDIYLVWDYVVKLITLVIPPLREIFMGRLSLSLDEQAWHSLTTRCVHAQFSQSVQSLEDFFRSSLNQFDKDYYNDLDLYQNRTTIESIKNLNAIIIGKSPDIIAFAIESAHLPSSLRFLDALSKNPSKVKPPATIKFPVNFNLSLREGSKATEEEGMGNMYDLAAVVTLEGQGFDVIHAYHRYVGDEQSQWYMGSGATHDVVDSSRAIEKNYFHISDTKKVHPRLLIYTKKGIANILDNLKDFVTKGGQLRSKGDATFDAAETPEHYDEAKAYYEEAIAHDPSLRAVLQERLNSLEQIERNQKAQSYENQADLSLGKRRFKEACDLYKLASRSAVPNSQIYARIKEKEEYMMRIISLEIANHLTEKGEDCLKSGSYVQSRENFAQALKLNPNYTHLQSIINGIDKLITAQTSAQKVSEANQAMKIGRYKYANQLFLEAVALVPEREATLKPVLDSLIVLMQGEDALMKQRSGLVALEDKKYAQAISLITEAISLLPPESIAEHAFFLCDRAQVYFEMKDYETSVKDCFAALQLRPELAMAYLRLGSAQFEMEHYDEALVSYEKAMRSDPSLNDQVKVKIRQVNTAKEVQERKLREAERARIKEEEQRRIEEKRAREEKLRKEKQEKQVEEQREKVERTLMKAEETRTRSMFQKEEPVIDKSKAKESNKERLKREKAEKESQKALEKERIKAEKERERERVKAEKEQKAREEQMVKDEELRKQREFQAEMERAAKLLQNVEREKELERERARLERERMIAEREKTRQEKKNEPKKAKKAEAAPVVAAKVEAAKAAVAASTVINTTAAAIVAGSTAAAIVAGTTSTAAATSTDPDFPTLGAKKSDAASTASAVKAKPTKWSALLGTGEEEKAKPTAPAPPVKKQPADDFPPLLDNPTTSTVTVEDKVLPSSNSTVNNHQQDVKQAAAVSNGLNLPPNKLPTIGSTPVSSIPSTTSMSSLGFSSLPLESSVVDNGNMLSASTFPNFSREASNSLESSLGLGNSLGDLKLSEFGSGLEKNSLQLPSLGDGAGFLETFGSPTFNRTSGLGSTLDDPISDVRPNTSRLSSLFGQSELSLGSDILGSGLLGGQPSSNGLNVKDSLGSLLGNDSFNLMSSFHDAQPTTSFNYGLGSGLGSNDSLFGGLGSSLSSHATESSRLDKILGLGGASNNSLDNNDSLSGPRSNNDIFSTLSFNDSSSNSLLGSNPPPGVASLSSLWMNDTSSASFSLSNLLGSSSSVPPPKKYSLEELGKKLDDEKITDFNCYPALNKLKLWSVSLFHWTSDGRDWLEFAVNMPENVSKHLRIEENGVLEISQKSACDIKSVESNIRSPREKFLVIPRTANLNVVLDNLLNGLSGLQPAAESANKWASLPQSILDSRKENFSVADSMIDSLISAPISSIVEKESNNVQVTSATSATSSTAANVSVTASAIAAATAAALAAGIVPKPAAMRERPPLLKIAPHPTGQVRRYVEIPAELIGLVIGHGGRKIKDLATDSSSRIQFKTSKTSEREGKPGVLEVQGTADSVDKALSMVWELLQSVGREYREVTGLPPTNSKSTR